MNMVPGLEEITVRVVERVINRHSFTVQWPGAPRTLSKSRVRWCMSQPSLGWREGVRQEARGHGMFPKGVIFQWHPEELIGVCHMMKLGKWENRVNET